MALVAVTGISIERCESGKIIEARVSWDFFGMMAADGRDSGAGRMIGTLRFWRLVHRMDRMFWLANLAD